MTCPECEKKGGSPAEKSLDIAPEAIKQVNLEAKWTMIGDSDDLERIIEICTKAIEKIGGKP